MIESKRTAAFITLGCKVNQSETQGMMESFAQAGYIIVDSAAEADVYVVNTCSVTAMSQSKSRQLISRAHKKNPQACIAVTGCYAQRAAAELLELPGVCVAVGTNHKGELMRLCTQYLEKAESINLRGCELVTQAQTHYEFEELPMSSHRGHTRAYMKIEDGCDSYCSYCIIPYLRGPVRSRGLEAVAAEACRLAGNGFCELVLGGIHLTSYGKDNGHTLAEAVLALQAVEGVRRIRLGSLEPMGVTAEFLDAVAGADKLCQHFHLSLQSGCDSVLARMNRKYTTDEYYAVCCELRKRYPGCAVSTDIIVGFPGETDAEFEDTMRFVKKADFAFAHVFAYSRREGTAAADMPGQIDHGIKKQREKRLMELCAAQKQKYLGGFAGREVQVLIERESGGTCRGLTPQHAEVQVDGSFECGTMVNVYVEGVSGDGLKGRPVLP